MDWRTTSLVTIGLWMAQAWADSPKDVDAEIVNNLEFYQYLDVLETQEMYETMEKNADSSGEVGPNHRKARDTKRGDESP